MTGQFEIFRDGTRFRFRLTGEECEVLAVSGLFADKARAAKAIMAVRENAAAGHIVDKSSVGESAQHVPKNHFGLDRRGGGQATRPGDVPEFRGKGVGPATRLKLKFLIRLDVDMRGAHIQVRGRVTERNLGAVYAVARRTSAIIGGLAVVLDLRKAAVADMALAELRRASQFGELPAPSGSESTPCRLEILEPAAP
ncbi:YegP family protein [Arthrobacter sp. SA17]